MDLKQNIPGTNKAWLISSLALFVVGAMIPIMTDKSENISTASIYASYLRAPTLNDLPPLLGLTLLIVIPAAAIGWVVEFPALAVLKRVRRSVISTS